MCRFSGHWQKTCTCCRRRGTVKQLYLSDRFGLIRHRALNEEPLSVMMDDILVNFDPIRASACAEAIVELSKTHQLFFLSCHPATRSVFPLKGTNMVSVKPMPS